VVAGAYVLRRSSRPPSLTIAAMGAVVTEAIEAAERLETLGTAVDVVCITSPGQLFDAILNRSGRNDRSSWILDSAFPSDRRAPVVTVLDGHPHTLAFLAGIHQVPSRHLGVTQFGQSGDLAEVYRLHGLDTDSIVRAGLDLV